MASRQKMDSDEIARRVAEMPGWTLDTSGDRGDAITKTFTFHDFAHAVQFVNRVADAAEDADHHPDLDIRFNKVRVRLTTWDAGGITENDFALTDPIERAASVARAAA